MTDFWHLSKFIEERTKLVAKRITAWLKENGRFSKTIVFCMNTEHADLMRRALINENSDIVKDCPKYVMKITGDDDEGKKNLGNFILPDDTPPIIATTAELLTTGVDCKTVKLIVIDKIVDSIITFKQIIGRGTRLRPDCGKEFFTIMDFRGATSKFEDPEFDGVHILSQKFCFSRTIRNALRLKQTLIIISATMKNVYNM